MTTSITEITKRRLERISIALPILVDCKESKDTAWQETSHLKTVTIYGAGFNLQHQVLAGQLLHLTTAFPTKLRCYDFLEPQYKVWSLVRYCHSSADNGGSNTSHSVGVAFLGKNPPISYLEDPCRLYNIAQFDKTGLCVVSESKETPSAPQPRPFIPQKHPRYSIPFEVIVEMLDERKNPLNQEFTVTENISLGGAAVKSVLNTKIGDFVRISCIGTDVAILAAIRNRRLGDDGIPRLHLEFLDRQFPLEGIG